MAEKTCPVCGCTIVEGGGCEKDGVVYCCQSCSTGGPCECGCCTVVKEEAEK